MEPVLESAVDVSAALIAEDVGIVPATSSVVVVVVTLGSEGKTRKEAMRALKRRISDAVYQRLAADARR